MKIIISSKNKTKMFDDSDVIMIGSVDNCHFRIDADFDFVIGVKKAENGKYQIANLLKSDRLLFKGAPIGPVLAVNNVCKLNIAGTDDFIVIKTAEAEAQKPVQTAVSMQPKVKSLSMIEQEEINTDDIEGLYGSGQGAETKIKIQKRKADIDARRASVTKETAYKANYLRNKLAQNELILSVLNFFAVFVPLAIAYTLKDIIVINTQNGQQQSKVLFLIAAGYVITTFLLKQGQFLTLQSKKKTGLTISSQMIKNISMMISGGLLSCSIIWAATVWLGLFPARLPGLVPCMTILCSVLCMFIGIFAGFTQNIIAESGEELDGYESREDFQSVIKSYQQWIELFTNNLTRKKLKDIKNKIDNLSMKQTGEYIMGIATAPFLSYGVSQTLAECFPEAAGWIRLGDGFKFSPVFWVLASIMIVFAFHCFAASFAASKRIYASNIIKQDGFSNYNVHGVIIHGTESSKNLKREASKFLFIAVCVVLIEITMNVSYFIGVMGSDVAGMVLSFIAALLPTAILIMETTMLGNTKFEIIIREELLETIDKDF